MILTYQSKSIRRLLHLTIPIPCVERLTDNFAFSELFAILPDHVGNLSILVVMRGFSVSFASFVLTFIDVVRPLLFADSMVSILEECAGVVVVAVLITVCEFEDSISAESVCFLVYLPNIFECCDLIRFRPFSLA